jgi:hypothetical protein
MLYLRSLVRLRRGGVMQYVAICDGLADPIWSTGESESEALALLWEAVSQYLKGRQAPNSNMTAEQLDEYFGAVIIDLSKRGGFLR